MGGLWQADTFHRTPSSHHVVTADKEAAESVSSVAVDPGIPNQALNVGEAPGPAVNSYGWSHVDKHVHLWMTFPRTTKAKDVKVESSPTVLKISVAQASGTPGVFERRWWKRIDPDELEWELEPEDGSGQSGKRGEHDAPEYLRGAGVRRLHIEAQMATLERWEDVFTTAPP